MKHRNAHKLFHSCTVSFCRHLLHENWLGALVCVRCIATMYMVSLTLHSLLQPWLLPFSSSPAAVTAANVQKWQSLVTQRYSKPLWHFLFHLILTCLTAVEKKVWQQSSVLAATPMHDCCSHRYAMTQYQCTLFRTNRMPYCSLLLCNTGWQQFCIAVTPMHICCSYRFAMTQYQCTTALFRQIACLTAQCCCANNPPKYIQD